LRLRLRKVKEVRNNRLRKNTGNKILDNMELTKIDRKVWRSSESPGRPVRRSKGLLTILSRYGEVFLFAESRG